MTADLIRPPVTALRFVVFGRFLHPELFTVVAARHLVGPGYTVHMRLIPSGHVFSWLQGEVCLEEVVAEDEMELPTGGRLVEHTIEEGERTTSVFVAPRHRYHCCLQRERLPPEQFRHMQDELKWEGERSKPLFYYQPQHRLRLAPLSLIRVQPVRNGLTLTAFHTFPDDWTVVKTQSLLEWQT
ncbi:MAG: DUF2617 family protein [Gemmataceae bacterium]|nr:DUF2617 family protein [Gemmataceae bacterium]MDW8243802.1 DUF2617 family protein [Thermogemmata sp.]